MIDKLKKMLSGINADYADIRYEAKRDLSIVFNAHELTSLESNTTDGYVLRMIRKGGMSVISFTRESDAPEAIRIASENALLMSRSGLPVKLAETEVVQERFRPELLEDPRGISIEEKLNLTRGYNEIALGDKRIATTSIGYGEVIRGKFFANTEGTAIDEETVTTRISGSITAKEGNILQNVRVAIGGSNGFAVLRDSSGVFENKKRIALELLSAESVKAGVYNVVLNSSLAGVFTHEAFGHFSEADLLEDAPTMREKMQLGAHLGNEILNIKDDPTMPGQVGFYRYDDEGVRARPVQLMKNGVLTGRLHSRRTASSFGEPLTGHCVAEDYRYAPIVRMGTIFIEPGTDSLDTLLGKIGDGLYLLDAKGGQTSGDSFTFGAQYGYLVRNGKKDRMIRDINISGNLYQTLQNITAVGNDLNLSKAGGCGKGQTNIKSCHGAPHVIIRDVILGGV
ncbi:MAG: TldD/PmbA family protein [Candidatus Wallbacteria bacterium]|nr:TldD/PmbA family protein [Candidatus Wallbacteria bacterium]